MDITHADRREVAEHAQRIEDAWRELAPSAIRFATALVGPDDAHDIATSAFLRVTHQPHWDAIEHLDRYLMRAVRNEAQNLYRQRRRRWQRDLLAIRPDVHADQRPDLDV